MASFSAFRSATAISATVASGNAETSAFSFDSTWRSGEGLPPPGASGSSEPVSR